MRVSADRTARSARVRSPASRSTRSWSRYCGSTRARVHGQRPGRPRPQERVQGRPRGAAPGRVHAREDRRRAAAPRGGDRPRQEAQAHDRGRRRPSRDEARPPPTAHAVDRDRHLARRGARRRRRDRRQDQTFSERTSRVPSTACRFPSSSRGSSRSTRRTAHVRDARDSAHRLEIDPDLLVPDASLSIEEALSSRGRSAARASTTR